MPKIIIIAHNIRSLHNLGSIFRTAEGFGVEKIYLTGYTPNWHVGLPHIVEKMKKEIHKTALGAEEFVPSEQTEDPKKLINFLKSEDYAIVGLEQDPRAKIINQYRPPQKIALLLGEEVQGITPELRDLCHDLLEIPMQGQKESFNVSVATGIALYALQNPANLI